MASDVQVLPASDVRGHLSADDDELETCQSVKFVQQIKDPKNPLSSGKETSNTPSENYDSTLHDCIEQNPNGQSKFEPGSKNPLNCPQTKLTPLGNHDPKNDLMDCINDPSSHKVDFYYSSKGIYDPNDDPHAQPEEKNVNKEFTQCSEKPDDGVTAEFQKEGATSIDSRQVNAVNNKLNNNIQDNRGVSFNSVCTDENPMHWSGEEQIKNQADGEGTRSTQIHVQVTGVSFTKRQHGAGANFTQTPQESHVDCNQPLGELGLDSIPFKYGRNVHAHKESCSEDDSLHEQDSFSIDSASTMESELEKMDNYEDEDNSRQTADEERNLTEIERSNNHDSDWKQGVNGSNITRETNYDDQNQDKALPDTQPSTKLSTMFNQDGFAFTINQEINIWALPEFELADQQLEMIVHQLAVLNVQQLDVIIQEEGNIPDIDANFDEPMPEQEVAEHADHNDEIQEDVDEHEDEELDEPHFGQQEENLPHQDEVQDDSDPVNHQPSVTLYVTDVCLLHEPNG